MKRGVLGLVDGEFDTISSFELDNERKSVVDVRKERETENGYTVIVGGAAIEKEVDDTSVQIDGTNIEQIERKDTQTVYTEFITVPGEFVLTSSSSGDFVFDLIARKKGVNVERAEVDLHGFLEDLESPQPWKIGFYNHFGKAENGVLHGAELLDDADIGETLGIADKNQLGVTYKKSDDTKVKANLTESGYIEVYTPDFDSEEFAQFVSQNILPYSKKQLE